METQEMKTKQIINEDYILFCSDRSKLIDFVLKYANDEIENDIDWYNLAVLSTEQLKDNIKHIIEYYKTELNETIEYK